MEEANPNNYIVQNLAIQNHCSKKKFIIPLFIIKALALILCIIKYIYKVTNLKIYEEFEAQNKRIDSTDNDSSYNSNNDMDNPYNSHNYMDNPYNSNNYMYNPYHSQNYMYNSYNSSNYINEILDLKKQENEMTILNLIPNIISFISVGFLFLHFWFEEKCFCYQRKYCISECHIMLNSVIIAFVNFIEFIASLLDCLSTRSTIDKYNNYFTNSDFQKRNQINKIIDIFIILIAVSTYILLIIVSCYVNRENNMCNMYCSYRFCGCCCLCEIDCCHLCTCCDIPPASVYSISSLNNQPYNQQQNVVVLQQYGNPMNNNSNNADNTAYSSHDLKKIKLSNYQANQQMPSSTDEIHQGKKKLTNNKKKKNETKSKGCIIDKYNKDYENISACTICNTNFENGENILILPCGHIFHHNCAISWFKSNNNICPIDGIRTN